MKRTILSLTIFWLFAAIGCSACITSPANNSNTSRAGDSELTVARVTENPDAYKGRRVRWFGRTGAVKMVGKIIRGVYINDPSNLATSPVFAVEIESNAAEFKPSELPEAYWFAQGWITGTIDGVQTVTYNLNGQDLHKTVPVLRNVSFEKDNNMTPNAKK